jgi:hypothetical protein
MGAAAARMNAIKMLEDCATRQAYLTLFSQCECGERIALATAHCATCAVRAEIKWIERMERKR